MLPITEILIRLERVDRFKPQRLQDKLLRTTSGMSHFVTNIACYLKVL